ncbi:MAG: hypothetical protein IJV98_08745, partial [Clostridia bacterium]|nr:hypothetical protein [Clostridia bacterium]
MTTSKKIVVLILSLFLCFMFVVSYVDTGDTVQKTNLDQDRLITHIEKLSEHGPRSIAHPEANKNAIEYIVSELDSYGAVQGD